MTAHCTSSSSHTAVYPALANSQKNSEESGWRSDVLPSQTGLGQGGSTITAGCWLFNPQNRNVLSIITLGNTELDITHY